MCCYVFIQSCRKNEKQRNQKTKKKIHFQKIKQTNQTKKKQTLKPKPE